MTAASGRSVDAGVVAALAGWLPRNARGLTPTVLAVVEPVVRSAVAAAAPRTLHEGRWFMRNGFALATWVYAELGTVDVRVVFHPDNVETFVFSINRGQSARWQYDVRRALTKIGRAVNQASWARTPTKLRRSAPARPYSSVQEEAVRLAAVVQGRPGRADEVAVVALSLGAGLNGPEIAAAMPSDVVGLGNGRVAVRGQRNERATGTDTGRLHRVVAAGCRVLGTAGTVRSCGQCQFGYACDRACGCSR